MSKHDQQLRLQTIIGLAQIITRQIVEHEFDEARDSILALETEVTALDFWIEKQIDPQADDGSQAELFRL